MVNSQLKIVCRRLFPDGEASFHEINCLVYAGACVCISTIQGSRNHPTGNAKQNGSDEDLPPQWQIRVTKEWDPLRSDVSRLTSMLRYPSEKHHDFWRRSEVEVGNTDELKMKLQGKKDRLPARMHRYRENENAKKANKMFQMNERALCRTLREPANSASGASYRLETSQFPEAGEATEFWSELLSTPAPFTAGEWYVRQAEYYEEQVPVQSSAE